MLTAALKVKSVASRKKSWGGGLTDVIEAARIVWSSSRYHQSIRMDSSYNLVAESESRPIYIPTVCAKSVPDELLICGK